MTDSRCFIQLHHDGWEHDRRCAEAWHSFAGDHPHQRKFLQLDGEWIDEGGHTQSDELWLWGEWEAESKRLGRLEQPSGDKRRFPSTLWLPSYRAREDYLGLHNTDPFIFGEQFLYSNCGQRRGQRGPGKTLKELASGSLIVFGSCVSNEWVLDTVFVVGKPYDYCAASMREDLADVVPDAFMDVTGEPIIQNERADLPLRLYVGATPADPVNCMFSFFPARPAGGDAGFARPRIDLPSEYFNPKKCQNYKQTCDLSPGTLRGLWDSLVAQVREAGLVLGTYAELPERREA